MQKQKYVIVWEVAKKLWVDFSILCKEFAECWIRVKEDDKVTLKTLKYVLSGMNDYEYDWGNHLHLETWAVAWEIDWGIMRKSAWSELDFHNLNLHGRSQKLWIEESILLNELYSHWWKWDKEDVITMQTLAKVIDGAELESSYIQMVTADADVESYVSDKNNHIVTDIAWSLWIPSIALMSWLHYNWSTLNSKKNLSLKSSSTLKWDTWSYDVTYSSSAWKTCNVGCEVEKYWSADAQWVHYIDEAKESYKYRVANENEIDEGIVAVGYPDASIVKSKKIHGSIAWWLLSLLAIPLLFWLLWSRSWSTEVVQNDNTEVNWVKAQMVLHWASDDTKEDSEVAIKEDDWRREDMVEDTIVSIIKEPTTWWNKSNSVANWVVDWILSDAVDSWTKKTIKTFVDNLWSNLDDATQHWVALPTELPKTWSHY